VCFEIPGHPGRYLFFAIFWTPAGVAAISHYYRDAPVDFHGAIVDVRLPNGSRFRLDTIQDLGLDEYEPTRCVLFPFGPQLRREVAKHETIQLELTYGGHSVAFSLHREELQPSTFALATLFKDDYHWLDLTYRYYKRQGVDRFYFFYNGDISRIVDALPPYPDIVYGSWPFQYWSPGAGPTGNYLHHAQTTFLTMVMQRFHPHHEFLLLNDLDEFVQADPDKYRSLLDFLTQQRSNSCWIAPNVWSKIQECTSRDIVLRANRSSRARSFHRAKSLYHKSFRGPVGIHFPKRKTRRELESMLSDELRLYHIVDFWGGRRTHLVEKEASEEKRLPLATGSTITHVGARPASAG
jgi:hypothetical protein